MLAKAIQLHSNSTLLERIKLKRHFYTQSNSLVQWLYTTWRYMPLNLSAPEYIIKQIITYQTFRSMNYQTRITYYNLQTTLKHQIYGTIKSLQAMTYFFKTRRMPTASLVSWNYFTKGVCMYACIYICLSAPKWANLLLWSMKAACIQTIKANQSLNYTHTQVSSASKASFLHQSKTRYSDRPQTSRPAFLVGFSGVIQPKTVH